MRRDLELALELDSRESQRFHGANVLWIDLRPSLASGLAAFFQFVDALLQSRFGVD